MNRNKLNSFTILEILIVIMVIGILSVGLMSGFKSFQEDLTAENMKKKMAIVKKQMEEVMELKVNNFIYSDAVLTFDESNNTFTLYNTNTIQSIFTQANKEVFFNFLNLGEKDLLDFRNIPFDIVVENKYANHYVKFPYKNIFVISWGKLNSYGFNDTLKELFIRDNGDGFTFRTFSEMEQAERNILTNWANLKGLNDTIFNKEINYFQISNLNIMKKKIENSITRFNNIVDNIEHWVDSKIRSEEGTGAIPGKNNFMFFKTKLADKDADATNLYLTDPAVASGDKIVETKMTDFFIDENENIGEDKISNVFAFINESVTDINANDRFTSTRDNAVECEDRVSRSKTIFLNFSTVSNLPVNQFVECTQTGNVKMFSGTKKILGVTSDFEGREDFSGLPILISNVDVSHLELESLDINSSNMITSDIYIDNTIPLSVAIGANYKLDVSPPYSIIVSMQFPWMFDGSIAQYVNTAASDKDAYHSKYGLYIKRIFSVTGGL